MSEQVKQELPPLDVTAEESKDAEFEYPHGMGFGDVGETTHAAMEYAQLLCRERQLLAALSECDRLRELAHSETARCTELQNEFDKAIVQRDEAVGLLQKFVYLNHQWSAESFSKTVKKSEKLIACVHPVTPEPAK